MGPRINDFIDVTADLVMLIAAGLIAWRLALGMLDNKSYSETTFILQFALWISNAAGLPGAVVFVIVAGWCVLRPVRKLAEPAYD